METNLKKWWKTSNRGLLVLGLVLVIGLIVYKVKDVGFQKKEEEIKQVIRDYIEGVWELNMVPEDRRKSGYVRTTDEINEYKEKVFGYLDEHWSKQTEDDYKGIVVEGVESIKNQLNYFFPKNGSVYDGNGDIRLNWGVPLRKDYAIGDIRIERISDDIVTASVQYDPYWAVSYSTYMFTGFGHELRLYEFNPNARESEDSRSYSLLNSVIYIDLVHEDGTWKIIQRRYQEPYT